MTNMLATAGSGLGIASWVERRSAETGTRRGETRCMTEPSRAGRGGEGWDTGTERRNGITARHGTARHDTARHGTARVNGSRLNRGMS